MAEDPRDALIPENDRNTPRWLLDLDNWKIVPFSTVADVVRETGYGVVSYTWGYIADMLTPQPQQNTPEGILWDVPTTVKWPLDTARDVMKTIKYQYIWWDWMCVPQDVSNGDRPLTAYMRQVKGEEIGKQMHIYGNARGGIVWLHSTLWEVESPLRSLLLGTPTEGVTIIDAIQALLDQLTLAQKEERWLISGWTLQEGVIRSDARLIDGRGQVLTNERFSPSEQATAINLTDRITRVSINIAKAFLRQADDEQPESSLEQLVRDDPKAAETLLRTLTKFIKSGLVGYAAASPLYILAGKKSRQFGMVQDECYALLGAMGLPDVEVIYSRPMWEIKTVFFRALLDKYQWQMLLVPDPSNGRTAFEYLHIVDGDLLPIGVFVQTQIGSRKPPKNLPRIQYAGGNLQLSPAEGQDKIQLFSAASVKRFRYYCQIRAAIRIQTVNNASDDVKRLIQEAVFLPLEAVEDRDGIKGERCVLVEGFYKPPGRDEVGVFRGIIDIWCDDKKMEEVTSLQLDSDI